MSTSGLFTHRDLCTGEVGLATSPTGLGCVESSRLKLQESSWEVSTAVGAGGLWVSLCVTGQGAPAGGGEESRLNITPERMFPGSSRGPLQLRFGKDSAGLQR